MATDPWGIDDGYFDVAGTWHPTPPETRAALRAAMHGDPGADAPPAPGRPLWVVRAGAAESLWGACELRLETDGTYVLELIARYDLSAGAGGVRTIASGGTWRFLPSALDRTSGEIRLSSGEGQTSAAVAGVSLVHRMRPERRSGNQAHWVYIRR